MNFKKKIIYIGIISIIIIIAIIIIFFKNYKSEYNYDSAKKETLNFLNSNINNLIKSSKELLEEKSYTTKVYKDIEYHYHDDAVYFDDMLDKEYIQFEVNAQGMLGGQYWGIIYSKNDDLLNNKNIYIYDEKEHTGKNNNVFIREKIKENWYFFYDDWDGKVDIKNIMN